MLVGLGQTEATCSENASRKKAFGDKYKCLGRENIPTSGRTAAKVLQAPLYVGVCKL